MGTDSEDIWKDKTKYQITYQADLGKKEQNDLMYITYILYIQSTANDFDGKKC